MRVTIIFKDGDTATFGSAYEIYNDRDNLFVSYEVYNRLSDDKPERNTTSYRLDGIVAVIKGDVSFYEFQ